MIILKNFLREEKTHKRPNFPISAEEFPRKKQKIKKGGKKKKIMRRNKGCKKFPKLDKHSLASKRNVADRSQLYVILLIQNQKNKKSIGRYQVSTKEDDNSLEK
ncbi:unnamed protein product [Rhizophagus irregularis]|nr:unnamed protein product [Rhizophagus irregularis]